MDPMKELSDKLQEISKKHGIDNVVLSLLSNYAYLLMKQIINDSGENIDKQMSKLIVVNETLINSYLPLKIGAKDFQKKFVLIMSLCTLISGVAPEIGVMNKKDSKKKVDELISSNAEVYIDDTVITEPMGTMTIYDIIGYEIDDLGEWE